MQVMDAYFWVPVGLVLLLLALLGLVFILGDMFLTTKLCSNKVRMEGRPEWGLNEVGVRSVRALFNTHQPSYECVTHCEIWVGSETLCTS